MSIISAHFIWLTRSCEVEEDFKSLETYSVAQAAYKDAPLWVFPVLISGPPQPGAMEQW